MICSSESAINYNISSCSFAFWSSYFLFLLSILANLSLTSVNLADVRSSMSWRHAYSSITSFCNLKMSYSACLVRFLRNDLLRYKLLNSYNCLNENILALVNGSSTSFGIEALWLGLVCCLNSSFDLSYFMSSLSFASSTISKTNKSLVSFRAS